jgi:hypothetical protein
MEQIRQLGNIHRNPPRLIARQSIKLCVNRRPRSLMTRALGADDPCKPVVPYPKILDGLFHRQRKL